jgi:hypothetical protein
VDFVAVVDQVIALLRQRGRVTYSTLKRQFQLDEAALEDVKNELIEGQRVAVDERGNVLVWTGAPGVTKNAEKPRHSCRGWIGVGRAGLNAQEPNKTYAVPEPSMGEGTA